MKIAVLSGKGGTGKTTVSASLACSSDGECRYMDCDIEEPNGAIFLKPLISVVRNVTVPIPEIDISLCDFCGKCAVACQFNAIAVVKDKVIVFPEICHHCGACMLACPNRAIFEKQRCIGIIEADNTFLFVQGKLNIGEPAGLAILKEMKKIAEDGTDTIIDCPPGSSCTVVEAIGGCDYCVLVTQPDPFGLHDLKIAVSLVRKMGMDLGVVINKAEGKDGIIHKYCKKENINILLEIPFSRIIAEKYSEGILPVQFDPLLKKQFSEMYKKIFARRSKS